jgi:prophage tail gpP-like protein
MAEDLPEILVEATPPDSFNPDADPDDSNQGPPALKPDNPQGTPVIRRTRWPYLEHAVVVINGLEYWEWTSVEVRLSKWETPANTFRFTASEQEPQGQSWLAQRIVPGDTCEVYLDGYLAITGEVVTRQVYYDATQHQVEIQGQGVTGRMAESAMVSKTGEWKNIDFKQIASLAASQFGLGVMGTAKSAMQFPRVSVRPGESAWDLVERYSRQANTPLGETSSGQLELGLNAGGGARVVEGGNIISGRENIHSLKSVGGGEPQASGAGSDFKATGQAPGNDDEWGANPTHQRQAETPAVTDTFNAGFLSKVALSEVPAWSTKMLQARGNMEANVSDAFQIRVQIATLGWQRNAAVPPAGGLWKPGEMVIVHSPMLVMYNKSLILKAVTFTQNNETGSRSMLELVNPAALGGEPSAKDAGGGGGDQGGGEQ